MYNGIGDVKAFLAKMEILISLKGLDDGEKQAQALASKLEDGAFDVYLRMPLADRTDINKLKEELLKEFEPGQADREKAIWELQNRVRLPNEPARTYAYKIKELAKLAYPMFALDAQDAVANDSFMKGLHPDMQLQLKVGDFYKTAGANHSGGDRTFRNSWY